MKFKIFFLFLHLLFTYSIVPPSTIESLNKKISLNRLEEVISKAEKLKLENQENIDLRIVLFKAYLYKGLSEKAEAEINFIEKRIQNDRTVYLRALQTYQTNNWNESLNLLKSIETKRYADPYLLTFKIYLQKKIYKKAKENLDIYQSLEGKNSEWFFNTGKLLLQSQPESPEILREHILLYSKSYPVDHRQMYLRANYYSLKEQYDLALTYIDKAIYLSFSEIDYINQKSYFLFRDHQWNKLISFINKVKWNHQETEIRYLFLNNFIRLIKNKAQNTFFKIKNPISIPTVIAPLKKILFLNIENLKARFLLEEIIIANTSMRDVRRKPYAEYHFKKGQDFFKKGQYQNTQIEYRRMLQLYPYKAKFYKNYLEYLRSTKHYEDYYREVQNYEIIFKTNVLDQSIKKQLALKNIQASLAGKYKIIPLIPRPIIQALLIYEQRPFKENWVTPNQEIIVNQILFNLFKLSNIKIDNINKKKQLQKTLSKKYDYFIEFSSKDENKRLQLNLKITSPQRITIFDERYIFFGKNRYFQMASKVLSLTKGIFPKVGKVVAVKDRKVVFSLGKLNGLKIKDLVTIYKNQEMLGEFSVEEVDNYYSLITVNKIFTLSKIEIGDRVILQPKEELENSHKF